MAQKCPKCGSASVSKIKPAGWTLEHETDPMVPVMLAVAGIEPSEIKARPNAPDRACDSCGAEFRARLTRCPKCKSTNLAGILRYGRVPRWLHRESDETYVVPGSYGSRRSVSMAQWELSNMDTPAITNRSQESLSKELTNAIEHIEETAKAWSALQKRMGFATRPHDWRINRPTLKCLDCRCAWRPRPMRCPDCGSDEIAKITYGLIYMDMVDEKVDGPFIPGGCCISPDYPRFKCLKCNASIGRLGNRY